MKKNLTFLDRRNSSVRKPKHDAIDEVKQALHRKMPSRLGGKKSKPAIVIAHPSLFIWQE